MSLSAMIIYLFTVGRPNPQLIQSITGLQADSLQTPSVHCNIDVTLLESSKPETKLYKIRMQKCVKECFLKDYSYLAVSGTHRLDMMTVNTSRYASLDGGDLDAARRSGDR